jgi:Carbohydrate binding domain (family 25).
MELQKNISFNTDILKENSTVTLTYAGTLYQAESEEIYVHYGFGLLWEQTTEVKMQKADNGFQTEITLPEADTFNFCFRNENNEWDNNELKNYIFEIEQEQLDLVKQDIITEIDTTPKLKKSYIWSKKIKLALYKLLTVVPRFISGTWKKKKDNVS